MGNTDLQRFGARVRAERERLGISQEKLAEQAGLHRTYLGGVERGDRNVGLVNIIRIARALGVPVAALFCDVDRPQGRSQPIPRHLGWPRPTR